jgi:hypothetical protein
MQVVGFECVCNNKPLKIFTVNLRALRILAIDPSQSSMSEPASAFGPSSLLTNLLIREAAPPAPCLGQVHTIGKTLVGDNVFLMLRNSGRVNYAVPAKKGNLATRT